MVGDHAFDRRNKFERFAAGMDRHQLLTLTHPAVLADDIDAIDLADQVGGEAVESNPRIVVGFLHHPGVAGMKAVALRNLEAVFALHVRDLWTKSRAVDER